MDQNDPLVDNRLTLDKLPPVKDIDPTVQIGDASRVTGSVRIGAQTAIENCIIRGPVIIGQNCKLKDTYIGPYTCLGDNIKIVTSEIENTIIYDDVSIAGIEDRIQDSIIGARTLIERVKTQPAIYQFRVGEDSFIEIG